MTTTEFKFVFSIIGVQCHAAFGLRAKAFNCWNGGKIKAIKAPV